MEIPDYKPNSHKYKKEQQETKEVERRANKVISGSAKTRKKSEVHKLLSNFIPEDRQSLKEHVLYDIIIPGIKNAILDTLEVAFGGGRKRAKKSVLDKITYATNYSGISSGYSRREESRPRGGGDFDDIFVDSKAEAEAVLDQLQALIDTYRVARVTDLYDIVGLSAPYTGNRYGWNDLHTAEAVRMRDGSYMLKMPRAIVID